MGAVFATMICTLSSFGGPPSSSDASDSVAEMTPSIGDAVRLGGTVGPGCGRGLTKVKTASTPGME